ncbi:putative protein OS=Tsukamurella paurometabola (strain ATCC 8368 / DSM / CCUG 35730 /CIP 100753 / JCM 10117 / KCTC 9821 / NBRC 16120 / NCIMB 702349/ NCTC 13040) OX=521096 GN=Tpau_3157 PE=4 SV=1 [Tsukamurella paurometabola]|uniref:Uncharacterized protein n=1 Tax=Tsukamurella paurometabola (strain ATCC 8368 / DSM 20162 / CCUG 35730 / CIP 100753 / JCM 10117 / KCTC 9821 / NBRC 16120 / NCIMB 702349 / NCTC 13040) TaxID=521096 RepID=D5UV26_TSUPD|nr:hypothetical protein [Tsukamurella paurometabola]ADG79744.1 hypothetical protein Tpau_3157 [Tsukamurella paurometabola DSM 20162]SUP37025.1 Uncharacterised protein [Tsukamurella paurometabola]
MSTGKAIRNYLPKKAGPGWLASGLMAMASALIAVVPSAMLASHYTAKQYASTQRTDGYLKALDSISAVHHAIERSAAEYFGPSVTRDPLQMNLDPRAADDLWASQAKIGEATNRVLVFQSANSDTRKLANELTIYYADVAVMLSEMNRRAPQVRSDPDGLAGAGVTNIVVFTAVRDRMINRFGFVGECEIDEPAEECQVDDLLSRGGLSDDRRRELQAQRDPGALLKRLRSQVRAEAID